MRWLTSSEKIGSLEVNICASLLAARTMGIAGLEAPAAIAVVEGASAGETLLRSASEEESDVEAEVAVDGNEEMTALMGERAGAPSFPA